MAFPGWGDPGTPVFPGDPTSEAINQYGTLGNWYSHGGGKAPVIRYESPQGAFGRDPDTGAYLVPITTYRQPVVHDPAELGRWVAPAEARDPYVPILDVAPTPKPGTKLVPVSPPGSSSGPHNQTKPGTKRSSPKSGARYFGRGSLWHGRRRLYHG